jgi:hypothetical protein
VTSATLEACIMLPRTQSIPALGLVCGQLRDLLRAPRPRPGKGDKVSHMGR